MAAVWIAQVSPTMRSIPSQRCTSAPTKCATQRLGLVRLVPFMTPLPVQLGRHEGIRRTGDLEHACCSGFERRVRPQVQAAVEHMLEVGVFEEIPDVRHICRVVNNRFSHLLSLQACADGSASLNGARQLAER
jgi:hypothetical protein